MSGRAPMPLGWYVLGVVLQSAYLLAAGAGAWGLAIPLVIGLLWGLSRPGGGNAVRQGFLLGFVTALIALLVALVLGRVAPAVAGGSVIAGVAAVAGALLGNAVAPLRRPRSDRGGRRPGPSR